MTPHLLLHDHVHNSDYARSPSSFINQSPNRFPAFIWVSDQSDERYDEIRYQILNESETEKTA